MKNNCEICGMYFENLKIKANHIRWKHKDGAGYSKEGLKKLSDNSKKTQEAIHGKWIFEEVECDCCGNVTEIKYREDKKKELNFCSVYCSRSRNRKHSKETKEKISKSVSLALKGMWKSEEYRSKMLKSVNNRRFTSKGEEEIRGYFMEKYPEQEWTFGGGLIVEGEVISRDLYSNKLKICIEYDGIWHFKDIKGQLKRKQKKDMLLEKWCLDNSYKIIRIKEEVYKKNKEFWIKKIEEEILKKTPSIIKFYDFS